MKAQQIFKQLRNRKLPTKNFRKNTSFISLELAKKTFAKIPKKKMNKIVLVMILRSSIAMLPAFLQYFPKALVGFIGLKRDEKTAIAKKYYENLPKIDKSSIVIIPDPMLGTAGSLAQAIQILIKRGVAAKNIYYTGFIAAENPGIKRASKLIPKENLTIFAVDSKLDKTFYITPGLGDFGDRYFGYK